jgi:hypothetical protein
MAGRKNPSGRSSITNEAGSMNILSLSQPIQIENSEEARLSLEIAGEMDEAVCLITPPDGGAYAGPMFWQMMEEELREEYPDAEFYLVIDCGNDPSVVMKGLATGARYFRFIGEPETAQKLAEMAAASEACLIDILGEVHVLADAVDKESSLQEWISSQQLANRD